VNSRILASRVPTEYSKASGFRRVLDRYKLDEYSVGTALYVHEWWRHVWCSRKNSKVSILRVLYNWANMFALTSADSRKKDKQKDRSQVQLSGGLY